HRRDAAYGKPADVRRQFRLCKKILVRRLAPVTEERVIDRGAAALEQSCRLGHERLRTVRDNRLEKAGDLSSDDRKVCLERPGDRLARVSPEGFERLLLKRQHVGVRLEHVTPGSI